MPSISASNEWSPLRSVIVGRAAHSCFPSEPTPMVEATMPADHRSSFSPKNPFPPDILSQADAELDQLVSILQKEGVQIHRPKVVDWCEVGGYTGAMPRDGLITVGNHIIEAPFAWACRRREIRLAYEDVLCKLEKDASVRVIRAPNPPAPDTLYSDQSDSERRKHWVTNNSRPAFDAADFMRFGKTLLGQFSHVTNEKGVEYLRANVPEGYSVEILAVDDLHAMHIDATILPLREGLLVYNADRVSEKALRMHKVLKDWDLRKFPFVPKAHDEPPLYMTSAWLVMNVLVLDGQKVLVEEHEIAFAEWLKELGMVPILCPFRHVYSIGGSFHCATVDLVRDK